MEIFSLYVDPQHQRKGITENYVILWVGIPNVSARMFYEKNGAKIVPGFHRESAYGWRGGMVCYGWKI